MENILLNGLYYAVEFIKVWLAAGTLMRFKMKKNLHNLFALSLIIIMLLAPWYKMWESNPIFYTVVMYIVFFLSLENKKNIGWIVFIQIAITLIDTLVLCLVMIIYPFDGEQLTERPVMVICLNSISMLLLIFTWHKQKKNHQNRLRLVYSDAWIFIVCTVALVILIAPIQLNMLGKHYKLETLSAALAVTVIFLSIFLLRYKKQREIVRMENDMAQKMMQVQENYYTTLLKKEEETKAFRHDVKEHILCMQTLSKEQKYEELNDYILQMNQNIKEISPRFTTGNAYINLILSDLSSQFQDVSVDWTGKVPVLSLETMDICTLFYNLLKNAFEAANDVEDKTVHVEICLQESHLHVVISNSYRYIDYEAGYGYRTIKNEKGHGYGIANIRRCVKKYHGDYSVKAENGTFCTEITLEDVIKNY